MKRFFIIAVFSITLPSYALCPLDPSGNGSCTKNVIPPHVSIYENSIPNPAATNLKPLNSTEPINQMRNPNNRLNDTLNCPLGICSQGLQSPYSSLP